MATCTQTVDISTEHKMILERINKTHGLSIREQIEMGIDYLDRKFKAIEDPFQTILQSNPRQNAPTIGTSFSEWTDDNAIKEEETGDIIYCVNFAPTTKGRFVTQSIPDRWIYVHTIDNAKRILILKSPIAVQGFLRHLNNRSNFHQLEMNPQEEARVEHSLSELIGDNQENTPYKPAEIMPNAFF